MHRLFSLKYSFDLLVALLAAAGVVGVLQTFVIGRHYLIPTAILIVTVILGNLARFGYRDERWAKHMLFWIGVILTCHVLFALFWSVKYRSVLGEAFEYVFAPLTALLAYLVWEYGRRNRMF